VAVGKQLLVGGPISVNGSDVAPVALEARRARLAALDQEGEQRVTEILEVVIAGVVRQALERLEQRGGGEDEDLAGDQVARRPVGLVRVRPHRLALDLDDAVAPGVLGVDLRRDDGDGGVGGHMLGDERRVILDVDRVGAQHDEGLRRELADQGRVAPQRVGGAAVEAVAAVVAQPRLQDQEAARRAVEVPRPPVGQVVAERDRVELLGHPHVREARVVAVAQREVDEPMSAGEGDRRLGAVLGEQLQAPPAPPASTITRVRARMWASGSPSRRA
jgi:hypothetical protein